MQHHNRQINYTRTQPNAYKLHISLHDQPEQYDIY